MRLIGSLMIPSLLVASTALADPNVVAVDDEPISHAAAPPPTTPTAATANARGRATSSTAAEARGRATSSPAVAREAPRAVVDRRLPPDVGQLREARVAPPDPVAVSTGPLTTAREHDAPPPQPVAVAAATDDDVAAELALHQMRRQARVFDGCKSAALKRAPSATGSLVLALAVADRKVQSVRVTDDGVHDPAFTACVTGAAEKLGFALAAARFTWQITVR